MKLNRKARIMVGAAAVLAAAGGSVAVASSQSGSPSEESRAVIDDAAKQLGIPSSKLSDALKKALSDRVDAAVAAGRITKAEGDALKQRITANGVPLFGGLRHGFGHVGFGGLESAAGYIGITEAQLRTELEGGKSLAQVATAHGKSVDGLVNALYADAKKKLDDAVSAGRLTKAQETEILDVLKDRITSMVNRTGGLHERHFRGSGLGFRHFDGPTA
jgi:polyhydroxyalkanoate synthesis regulator phasin